MKTYIVRCECNECGTVEEPTFAPGFRSTMWMEVAARLKSMGWLSIDTTGPMGGAARQIDICPSCRDEFHAHGDTYNEGAMNR